MFADALDSVRPCTLPLVICTRHFDGTVEAGLATFVVLNREGWVLTAAHVLQAFFDTQKHAPEIREYRRQEAEIQNNPLFTKGVRAKYLKNLKSNPKWITSGSFWWGMDGVKIETVAVNPVRDLAVGQMQGFNPDSVARYPVFKNPDSPLRIGTSLCRLGYPFHGVQATFDEVTGQFKFAEGVLPAPQFPIEGIYTRDCMMIEQNSKRGALFLETSSPGLRGQSGGPIFDTRGRVCGIQSRTVNFPLGFSPQVSQGNVQTIEHQFLNVGIGAHIKEIATFLAEQKVQVEFARD
ncbi:MAG: serine protease [Candidatus Acidiferrum sp.]